MFFVRFPIGWIHEAIVCTYTFIMWNFTQVSLSTHCIELYTLLVKYNNILIGMECLKNTNIREMMKRIIQFDLLNIQGG